MKNYYTVLIGIFSLFTLLCAAGDLFPVQVEYPYGIKPATLSEDLCKSEYLRWKEKCVVECNGGYRVIGENSSETRVEGIGFGMLLSAYAADKEVFDGMYDFYKSKKSNSANGMMAWQVSCGGVMDGGSATDGDIDVAFALIVADAQWGENYLDEAITIIDILKDNVIIRCNDLTALAPGVAGGRAYGGCNETDISYYNPAFFRVFAQVSGDAVWDTLADDTYTILNNSANQSTGLVPDWQSVSGSAGAGGRIGYFRYDACRAPYRIAIDYLWNGNEQAKEWCTKISNWAFQQGPSTIVDGYNLDGSRNGSSHTSSFVGSFCVAAMCNSQEVADAFGIEVDKLRDNRWFNLCCRCCYLLALTGNLWQPGITRVQSTPYYKHALSNSSNMLQISNRQLIINTADAVYSAEIYSVTGMKITEFDGGEAKNLSIPLPDVPTGVYLVRVRTSGDSFTKQLHILK